MTPAERFLEEKGFAPTFNVYSNTKPNKPVLLKDLLDEFVKWNPPVSNDELKDEEDFEPPY